MHCCAATPVVYWYATQPIEGSFGGPWTMIMYTRHKEVLVDSSESKQTCQWISLLSMLHHDKLAGNLPLNFPRKLFLPWFRQLKASITHSQRFANLLQKGRVVSWNTCGRLLAWNRMKSASCWLYHLVCTYSGSPRLFQIWPKGFLITISETIVFGEPQKIMLSLDLQAISNFLSIHGLLYIWCLPLFLREGLPFSSFFGVRFHRAAATVSGNCIGSWANAPLFAKFRCISDRIHVPWEPTTFIFIGVITYNSYFKGLKTLIFHRVWGGPNVYGIYLRLVDFFF